MLKGDNSHKYKVLVGRKCAKFTCNHLVVFHTNYDSVSIMLRHIHFALPKYKINFSYIFLSLLSTVFEFSRIAN